MEVLHDAHVAITIVRRQTAAVSFTKQATDYTLAADFTSFAAIRAQHGCPTRVAPDVICAARPISIARTLTVENLFANDAGKRDFNRIRSRPETRCSLFRPDEFEKKKLFMNPLE